PFHSPSHSSRFPLSLHDALPIFARSRSDTCNLDRFVPIGIGNQYLKDKRPILMLLCVDTHGIPHVFRPVLENSLPHVKDKRVRTDRKSTRLNSSHVSISYADFCL